MLTDVPNPVDVEQGGHSGPQGPDLFSGNSCFFNVFKLETLNNKLGNAVNKVLKTKQKHFTLEAP